MVRVQRHSHTAQAAYHDLVSLLLDEAVSDIRGTPTRRQRGERLYWYDRYRVGNEVKERYLGEDCEQLRTRIEQHEKLKQGRLSRGKERARLVRLLRSERFLGLDAASAALVSAFSKAGVFRLGGTLVGTSAFLLYEGELALRLSADASARTGDVDIASFEKLAVALGDTPQMAELLREFRFEPVPTLDPGRAWRWRQSGGGSLVEFLTPSFRDDEDLRDLPVLGITARALHHLDYLIEEAIPAAIIYRDGILVRIPRAERFAIHKLIVADRRRDGPDSLKARKDLMQAELLMSILAEDRPTDLVEAYEEATARGPRWQQRVEASLKRAPRLAALLDRAKRNT